MDALYGLADGNNDLFVTLQEVGRYLEDHVTAEVAPVSQVPMVIGNRTERLAAVDAKLLADLRSGRTSQMKMLSPIEARGMEDEVLAGVDSTVRALYRLFKKALKDKVFLEPATACADAYYERLMAEAGMTRLHSTMTRNYAAALQDDAQQVLNTLLKTGLTDEVLSAGKAAMLYAQYPRYLQRAAELLGEGHYMYAPLQARKHFFEGKMAATAPEQQAAFQQALHWQPDMPHALAEMVGTFDAAQADSASWYSSKAAVQAPAWVVPYIFLAEYYELKAKQPGKAEELLTRAGQVDTASVLIWYKKANFYNRQKNYKEAERWFLKAIAEAGTDICFPCAWNNLGLVYYDTRRYAESEAAYEKAIQLDSTFTRAWGSLGDVYHNTRRYAESEAAYKKAIQLDSTFTGAWNNLGLVYHNTRRYAESEAAYEKAIQLDSTFAGAWGSLGDVYHNTRRYAEAKAAYEKAIQLDSTFVKAWNGLGALLCDYLRRYSEAEAAFDKAIQLDSTNAIAWNNLGLVYYNTRRYAESEAAFKKAIQLDSTYARAWGILGCVYIDTRRYAESEAALKKAIQLDSTDAIAWVGLGRVYRNTGRYAESEAAYEKAIQIDSTIVGAYNGLGALFCDNLRRYSEAEAAFKQAIQLDSTYAIAWGNLGNVYYYTQRYAEAEGAYQKAIQLNSTDANVWAMLAIIYSLQNQPERAFAALEQALKKDFTNLDMIQQIGDLAPLRALPEWKALMKKYFPEQVKD